MNNPTATPPNTLLHPCQLSLLLRNRAVHLHNVLLPRLEVPIARYVNHRYSLSARPRENTLTSDH